MIVHFHLQQDGAFKKCQFLLTEVMATVKLISTLTIMGAEEDNEPGSVYYIVSSDPILKLIQPR